MIGTGTTVGTTSVIGTITDIIGIATITIDTIDKRALALKQRRVCNTLTQARNGYSVGSLPRKGSSCWGVPEAARGSRPK